MNRHFYLVSGWASLGLGALGAFLPLLPTVPFVILAAFCFARSSPRLEAWLVTHPQFGHHIVAWREKGAISRKGKIAATAAFALSIVLAAIFSPWPWVMAPVIAAAVTGSWIWTRPEASSEERRAGKECVSTCSSRWSRILSEKKQYTTINKNTI